MEPLEIVKKIIDRNKDKLCGLFVSGEDYGLSMKYPSAEITFKLNDTWSLVVNYYYSSHNLIAYLKKPCDTNSVYYYTESQKLSTSEVILIEDWIKELKKVRKENTEKFINDWLNS